MELKFILLLFVLRQCRSNQNATWTNTEPLSDGEDTSQLEAALKEYYDELNDKDLDSGRSTYSGMQGKRITPQVLSQAMTKLWDEDVNRFTPNKDFAVSVKVKLNRDQQGSANAGKLYLGFDAKILKTATVKTLLPLFDNYNPVTGKKEVYNQKSMKEMNQFLDSILNTQVMKLAHHFLFANGYAPKDTRMFKEFLFEIWFSLYSRAKGVLDSCGFEHVFCGEFKNGEISGLHNWIRLYQLQYFNKLDYRGHFYLKKPNLISLQFRWSNHLKQTGSVFMGNSPEFDIAMYTICFLTRANGPCEFQIKNQAMKIISYQMNQGNRRARVGTAFPI